MKKILLLLLLCVSIGTYSYATIKKAQNRKVSFLRVSEQNIVKEDGSKHLILGTNLGNWLNPEGYMFGFQKTNAPWKINQMLCELIGPDDAAKFWKEFKENYITEKDTKAGGEFQTGRIRGSSPDGDDDLRILKGNP